MFNGEFMGKYVGIIAVELRMVCDGEQLTEKNKFVPKQHWAQQIRMKEEANPGLPIDWSCLLILPGV